MENFLTFEQLKSLNNNYERYALINESRSNYTTSVFLSHKHDEPISLIKQIKGFFVSQGAELYIDWMDKNMPEVTNSQTAERLKQKIKTSKKFVILATPESINSIWMPWEIGLADQMKGLNDIAILPVINEGTKWEKREYYQLYNRIERINDKWLVIKPENSYTGEELSRWLKQ